LTTHFLLRRFVSDAVLRQLVANHQFDLAFTLAERSSKATRVQLIKICVATNEHAGFRAAWHAARDFRLEDEFPLVKQRYFESTIARMVEKGQSEAALRYAGDDSTLRHAVVQRLIEAGDAVTAAEYAGRIGLDVSSDGDASLLGAGALKTLRLFLRGEHRSRAARAARRAPAAPGRGRARRDVRGRCHRFSRGVRSAQKRTSHRPRHGVGRRPRRGRGGPGFGFWDAGEARREEARAASTTATRSWRGRRG
jgi:hypothetical protein